MSSTLSPWTRVRTSVVGTNSAVHRGSVPHVKTLLLLTCTIPGAAYRPPSPLEFVNAKAIKWSSRPFCLIQKGLGCLRGALLESSERTSGSTSSLKLQDCARITAEYFICTSKQRVLWWTGMRSRSHRQPDVRGVILVLSKGALLLRHVCIVLVADQIECSSPIFNHLIKRTWQDVEIALM